MRLIVRSAAARWPHRYSSAQPSPPTTARYGANAAAGHTFTHDGVELYYEIYGAGEPLLMIHGNGASIGSLAAQIEYFREALPGHRDGQPRPRALRRQRRPLNYETLTDDLAALLDHLKVGRVDVLGWSDGGIEALLLGIRHPDKVNKLIAMAPNLNPPTKRCTRKRASSSRN